MRRIVRNSVIRIHREKEVKGGVIIDTKRIRDKLDSQAQSDLKVERQTELKIDNYQIDKQGFEFVDQQRHYEMFKEINNQVDLKPKVHDQTIFELRNNGFQINEIDYNGSLCLSNKQVFSWDIGSAEDIRSHSFEIINYINPKPLYVAIGTGKDKVNLPDSYFQIMKDNHITFDVLPTFEATSTFNVCTEDKIDVMAFLIPYNK